MDETVVLSVCCRRPFEFDVDAVLLPLARRLVLLLSLDVVVVACVSVGTKYRVCQMTVLPFVLLV